jgi:ribonucleoside-diphosphate reductase alpha chain
VYKRPLELAGCTTKVKTGCGSLYVTVNDSEGLPVEVFLRIGKSGGCAHATCESLGRLVSRLLQRAMQREKSADMSIKCLGDLVKQLGGIRCHADSEALPSCPSAVAQVLKTEQELLLDKYMPEEPEEDETDKS